MHFGLSVGCFLSLGDKFVLLGVGQSELFSKISLKTSGFIGQIHPLLRNGQRKWSQFGV